MKREEVEEVIACLAGERTLFRYFKDRYCLDLLSLAWAPRWQRGEGVAIRELKSGPFAGLLQKPIVKNALSLAGDGFLAREHLDLQWPLLPETYVLTLARWGEGAGSWEQTSRPGSNLVLQLNFSRRHDREYDRAIKPDRKGPFTFGSHPVHGGDRNTLGWVRIDCSFQTDEALIEEVQTDWLRKAIWVGQRVVALRKEPERLRRFLERMHIGGAGEDVESYLETLENHRKLWNEAALDAAITFIRQDLGLKRIYFHSYETGKVLKRIRGGGPPTSVYSQLPQKFCFALTEEAPEFLQQNKATRRRLKRLLCPRWYRLPC
ncbi:MAG: hypothetical protein P8X63_06680 [Desulfuromonadaceae bacterium]